MKKVKGFYKRALAMLLAATLVASSFSGMSLTAYAGNENVTVETVTETETETQAVASTEEVAEDVVKADEAVSSESGTLEEETVSIEEIVSSEVEEASFEAVTEEFVIADTLTEQTFSEEAIVLANESVSYNGTESAELDRSRLVIDEWEYLDVASAAGEENTEFTDQIILDILTARAEAGESFNIVEVSRSAGNSVSVSVWNAVIDILTPDESGYEVARYNFSGGETADKNWSFSNPAKSEVDLNLAVTMTPGEAGAGVTVNFAQTDFPTEYAGINFYTDIHLNGESVLEKRSDYDAILAAFGDSDVEIVACDSKGNEIGYVGGWFNIIDKGEEGAYISFNIGDVNSLEKETTYSVVEKVYKGEVEEQEDGRVVLRIKYHEANKEYFEGNDIVEILKLHEGNTYDEVYIEQPFSMENHVIHKAVVEEAVNHLKAPTADNAAILTYSFSTEDTSIDWQLVNPKADQSADQTVTLNIGLDGDVPTVSVGSFAFNADDVNVWYGGSPESALAEKLRGYFGEESCDLEIGDGESFAGASYNVDEWSSAINFFGLQNLEADTVYDLGVAVYDGRVEDWDDGKHVLFIEFNEAHEGSAFTKEEILALLDAHAEDSFDEICITQPDTKDVIYKEVADKAAALLKNEDDRVFEDVILKFVFSNMENGYTTEWRLINPEAEQEADQTVSVNNILSGDTLEFVVGSQNLKTESIDIAISRPVETFSDEIEYIRTNILPYEGEGCDIILTGTEIEGAFHVDEWNAWLDIWGADRLVPDVSYNVEKKPYRGNIWDDETKGLVINYMMAEKDASFTEEELLDILEYHEGEAHTFDAVTIVQATDTDIIYKSVVDKATMLLKEFEDKAQGQICYAFFGENKSTEWILVNPATAQDSDRAVSANTIVSVSDNKVSVTIGEHGLLADRIDMNFVNMDSVEMGMIKHILKMEEGGLVRLAGTEVTGQFIVTEENVSFCFENVDGLTPDQEYIVESYEYNGDVFEDENGRHLVVDCFDMENGGIEYSKQAMIDILNSYDAEDVFTTVSVTVPVEGENTSNVIDKDIYNAAIKHLAEDNMGFSYNFDNGERVNCWEFAGAQELSANVTMKYDLAVTDENVSTIKFTLPTATALKNAQVNLGITLSMGEELTDHLMWSLGDGTENTNFILFPVEKVTTAVQWQNVMGRAMRMNIPGVNLQTKDKVYSIIKSKPGNVETDDEGNTSLYVSAFEFGKDAFAAGELAQYMAGYITDGDKFDVVHVEQKYTTANTLRKEDINVLRQLLKEEEESEKRLTYVFCRCEEKEIDENTIACMQNDLNFSLMNPGEATSNINANITLTTPANQGIKVKTNVNTINADDVFAQYIVNPETALGQSLIASLGMPMEFGNELCALKNGTEFDESAWGYYEYNMQDDFINLHLPVGNLVGKTEYMLSAYEEIEVISQAGIPEEFQALLDMGATSCVWKSYHPNVATISSTGSVTPINEGDVLFSVSYELDGQKYFKLYITHAYMGLESISFRDTVLKMELPEEGADWEATNFIDVKYNPSNASVDRDPGYLTWTTSDASVVELVAREDDGKFDGQIRAVGSGTATIKAVFPDDESIYAECVVTVDAPFVVPEEAWGEVYAVTNFDKTLEDVELPVDENGQWKWTWKNPDTKLASFANMDYHNFPVIFKTADGRDREMLMGVSMVTLSGVNIIPIELQEDEYVETVMPEYLENGNSVVFNFIPQIKNGEIRHIAEYLGDRIQINWTSNPKNIGTTEVEDYPSDSYKFIADATNPGKKTFTISLVDTKNKNKVIAKDSISVTVVKNPLVDYSLMPENLDELATARPGDTGTLRFEVPKAGYYKLTVKSSDSAVMKLGTVTTEENEENQTVTTIVPYEVKKVGITQISVTAKDELKSKMTYNVAIVDSEPIVDTSLVTVNTVVNEDYRYPISYNVEMPTGFTISDCEFGGKDIALFDASYEDNLITFEIKDYTMDAGTYKVSATLTSTNGAITDKYTKEFKIKVINSVPKVTFKQTKKVNTFYTSTSYVEEHFGQLVINTGKNDLASATIVNDAEEDFVLQRRGSNLFYLQLKPDTDEIDNTITIEYTVADIYGLYTRTKDITIKTEDKAPAIVINPGTVTLYPNQGMWHVAGQVSYKKGDSNINLTSMAWVAGKDDVRDVSAPITAELKKNSYTVQKYGGPMFGVRVLTANSGTDTLKIRVQADTWTRPLDVSMKLKVDPKDAKLTLSKATITLNKNDAVYMSQSDISDILFKGNADSVWFDNITFTGANAKSAAILNKELVLEYRDDMDRGVVARLNTTSATNKDLKTDTYKYKIWAEGGNVDGSRYKASTTLTVKIVDVAPTKALKVTKKGKIDVLQRESNSPCLAYIPKLSNLAGSVVDGYLTGQDADMFEWTYNQQSNQLEIRPKYDESYSTKNTYKVQPVFIVESFDGGRCDVPAAVQSFKVTQGKPVVTINNGNKKSTLYRQAGNELTLDFNAAIDGSYVAIEDIYLMNYTDDLSCEWVYEYFSGDIKISQHSMNQITTTGKTWTLKFGVKYRDQAGNLKDTVVSHKVVIK